MRGANMNSCIAPPMVCMEMERGGGVNDNEEGKRQEREKERERERDVKEEKRKRKHYSLLAARRQGRVQSPGYLPLCI